MIEVTFPSGPSVFKVHHEVYRFIGPMRRADAGAKPGFSEWGAYWKGRTPSEARRAESGVGFFRRGQPAPSPPVRLSGERCELPQRDLGRSPGRPAVFLYFECSR